MTRLIKNAIWIVGIILIAGVSYHLLYLNQQGKDITWEEVGVGTKKTVEKTTEIYDNTSEDVDSIYNRVKDGYEKEE